MDSRSIASQIEKCRKEGIYVNYYDTYLPYIVDDDYDWSYPAPEMQLLWRLDDLQERLEELIADGAPYRDEFIFLEDDIKYALPNPNTLVFEVPEIIEKKLAGALALFELIHEELPKAA